MKVVDDSCTFYVKRDNYVITRNAVGAELVSARGRQNAAPTTSVATSDGYSVGTTAPGRPPATTDFFAKEDEFTNAIGTEKQRKRSFKDDFLEFLSISEEEKKAKEEKSGGFKDPTARLTKQLVFSRTKEEILPIMSEAYKALGEALQASVSGDEEAIEAVRRLKKLIRRINRKMSDLGKEELMQMKEKRAQKQELEQLARQHEMQLKRMIAERKKREKKYLDDPDAQDKEEEQNIQISFGAMTQAELEALIRQMMPAALSAASMSADMGGDFNDASFSSEGGGEMAGGEVASAEVSVE